MWRRALALRASVSADNQGQEPQGKQTTKDAGFCSHPLNIVAKLYVLEPFCAFTRSCVVSQTWRWHLLFKQESISHRQKSEIPTRLGKM